MRLIWNHGHGLIEVGAYTWSIDAAPALGFQYDGLFYDDVQRHFVHLRPGGQSPMSVDECAATRAYLDAAERPAPSPPSPAAIQAAIEEAVQNHLDDTARARGYGSILSLCTYAGSSNARYAIEGTAGLAWRDAVWSHCYQVLIDVQAGSRAAPSAAELIGELPVIGW